MFQYKLTTIPKFNVNEKTIDSIFEIFSKIVSDTQKWMLNIVFMDSDSIKNLNNTYRKQDKVTDVLSFHYFENFKQVSDKEVVWELVFCEKKIIEQAKEYGLGEEKEFYKLLIHSILHILWYDHENDEEYKKMHELEDKIWWEVF